MSTATAAAEAPTIPHMVLVAKGRDDAYRAHRTTCKRVPKGAVEVTSFAAVNADHATPAACCKPTLPEPNSADGFDAWVDADRKAKGKGAQRTVQVEGAEVVGTVAVEVTTTPKAAESLVERLALAKAEHKILKEWVTKGEKPPRPATPNLDAINEEHAARVQGGGRKSKKAAKAEVQGVTVRFFHDDKPMPNSQNKLSSVAYYFTKGIKRGADRISTEDLRAIIAKAGVANPANTEWELTLANGVKLHTKRL